MQSEFIFRSVLGNHWIILIYPIANTCICAQSYYKILHALIVTSETNLIWHTADRLNVSEVALHFEILMRHHFMFSFLMCIFSLQEVMTELIKNSATFNQKTKFSQEKWIKKKKKR